MSLIISCPFRTEQQILKARFKGWDDVIAVDYTRTSESVQRRGADIKVFMYHRYLNNTGHKAQLPGAQNKLLLHQEHFCCSFQAIMERDKMKTDLSALFMPRQPAMNNEEAVSVVQPTALPSVAVTLFPAKTHWLAQHGYMPAWLWCRQRSGTAAWWCPCMLSGAAYGWLEWRLGRHGVLRPRGQEICTTPWGRVWCVLILLKFNPSPLSLVLVLLLFILPPHCHFFLPQQAISTVMTAMCSCAATGCLSNWKRKKARKRKATGMAMMRNRRSCQKTTSNALSTFGRADMPATWAGWLSLSGKERLGVFTRHFSWCHHWEYKGETETLTLKRGIAFDLFCSLQKKFESLFGEKLEVVRTHQVKWTIGICWMVQSQSLNVQWKKKVKRKWPAVWYKVSLWAVSIKIAETPTLEMWLSL